MECLILNLHCLSRKKYNSEFYKSLLALDAVVKAVASYSDNKEKKIEILSNLSANESFLCLLRLLPERIELITLTTQYKLAVTCSRISEVDAKLVPKEA